MRAPIRFVCFGLLTAGLTSALPFEAIDSRHSNARAPVKSRSYAIVNVDGSSGVDAVGQIDAGNKAQDLQKRAPTKSYSVVNVDGGPTSASTSDQLSSVTLTETVSATTTAPPLATETIVYTQDTTIVVTETQYPAPSVTQTVVYTTTILASPTSTSSAPTTAAPTSTIVAGNTTFIMPSLTSSPVVSVSVVTLPPSVVTVTATHSDTTSYYDNGMWHTSYAIKTWTTIAAA
ncbi:carbohydrate binding family 6 [Neofusicoccum parvum]|uniref:Carbohydrate binding family 6 n=1 Tax=Neofusicoccum parvum TaxID=310453 RepID=A0ACB5RS82_9PEZI|nr:carbohydrate binding family 6 [Neofusicoccum parvum]